VRVIGGRLGGRRLVAPEGDGTRPTSDRVREAIFNILGPPPDGARVLDLFAGAGALGIEALSRGAGFALFVDQARSARRCVEQNLATLGLSAAARVVAGDARRVLADLGRTTTAAFDWAFVDPPYASDLAATALAALGASDALLGAGAVVVVEHDRRTALDPSYGALALDDQRRYGDTAVSFYRRGGHDEP
jgi:16S rRNA (guanine966-N2)-methyltransferase